MHRLLRPSRPGAIGDLQNRCSNPTLWLGSGSEAVGDLPPLHHRRVGPRPIVAATRHRSLSTPTRRRRSIHLKQQRGKTACACRKRPLALPGETSSRSSSDGDRLGNCRCVTGTVELDRPGDFMRTIRRLPSLLSLNLTCRRSDLESGLFEEEPGVQRRRRRLGHGCAAAGFPRRGESR
jgi:hypothetical protein